MSEIRTISLEFVRSGLSHNQLLSPMTRYLGLCGDFAAATVSVPHEHRYFMRLLRELKYSGLRDPDAETRRRTTLEQLGNEMGRLLGQVPGLVAGLTDARRTQAPLTHLELVMSAAELALLPFELATVPPNCQGGEKSLLLLRSETPVCLTRKVRDVSSERVRWPTTPRILFVAASPANLKIPLEQHIQVLLANVQPWTRIHASQKHIEADDVSDILTFLPNASIHEVLEACRHTAYTHVHVLAHGMTDKQSEEHPIGLAMRGRGGGIDIVTGERFAAALRTNRRVDGEERASLPTVVTLATCDSGKIDDIIYSGASFAHQLHQGGIPFVVASQFPLSFAGSIHLVDVLYRKLLLGEDPRTAIHTVRRKLYTLQAADTHDWASLVVYAALPADLDEQMEQVRYEQARKAINMAMDRIDKSMTMPAAKVTHDAARAKDIEKELERVEEAASRLPTTGAYGTEGHGLLGATYKRVAEIHFRMLRLLLPQDKQPSAPQCYQALCKSREHYWLAVRENFQMRKDVRQIKTSRHWAMVQYLCLGAVLGDKLLPEHWFAAKASAELDAKFGTTQARVEAHSSLAELYLLLLAYQFEESPKSQWKLLPPRTRMAEIEKQAAEHVSAIVELAQDEASNFIVYATRRQLRRYIEWWGTPEFVNLLPEKDRVKRNDWNAPDEGTIPLAEQLLDLLPEPDQA